jgi:phage terminase large subunit-like protein
MAKPQSLKSELLAYCTDVLSGKVIACQKHRWACLRFQRDIERQDTADFPYHFNEQKAQQFFKWMRLFTHRKGVLKGKKIEPHIIQKFVFGNIYGWIHVKTGYRRFNKFYWQVGRKNAKSQSLALVGTFELMAFLENETSEVFCAATKTEQAKIVYDEAAAMLEGCKLLKGRYRIAYGRITHLKSASVMRCLSEEDRKTGDGLNPQCGIIDEYHAHEDSLIYDIIDSGMGARSQPLLGIITTAGFELAYPCYRVEYDLVSKILNPDIQVNLDSYFVMINELDKNNTTEDLLDINGRKVPPGELIDDINDENVWEKANPIACSYPEGREYIQKKLKESLEAPEKMRNFLTKHMNVWVSQRESGYMNMDKWVACGAETPDLSGKTCFVGLDLSAKLDLTSVGWEFPLDDKFFCLSHSFIPAETLEAKAKTDKVPYGLWVQQGWITATEGPVIDYRAVRDYVISTAKECGWTIQEICLDPWGAAQISNDLIEEGFVTVEIIQGIKTLSEPTKNFRELVYQKRINHDNNPVLSWAISNAIVDTVDRNQNIILSKKKSKQRIDPIAALINAHVRAMVAPVSTQSRIFFV